MIPVDPLAEASQVGKPRASGDDPPLPQGEAGVRE